MQHRILGDVLAATGQKRKRWPDIADSNQEWFRHSATRIIKRRHLRRFQKEATKIKAEENEDEEESIAKIEETEAEEEDHQEATNIKADENEDEEESISFGGRTAADDASTCLGRCSCSHRAEAQALARHREFQSGAATAARLG